MGWKNVKEHYRIDHQVQVTNEGICIGSPYIHAIIIISLDGALIKEDDRTLNDKLSRYQAEMKADPDKLRDLVLSEDKFSSSIPVYTYDGATIVQKFCEKLGWPNVTHDGAMMYDNTFFADREAAVEAAKRNCKAAILLRRSEIAGLRSSIASSSDRLDELLSQAKELGMSDFAEMKPSQQPTLQVTNPATIAQFVSALGDHGVKLPLLPTEDDVGTLTDADGNPVLVVDVNRERSDEDVAWIVGMIQVAVNTCGGFKAQRREVLDE